MWEKLKKPDFFIVGAPKCGTTAMNDYLRQHPEIFIPDAKELHFFGSDLNFRRQRITLEQYLSYFSGVQNEKRIGESSVWYLYSKVAATEIKEFCPSARIIIMLRNPVDMLYSLHSQHLFNGREDIEDFGDAMEAEVDRKNGIRIPKGKFLIEGLFYREVAKYTTQVQRYLNIFGKEKVHIIIFDDFKNNTDDVFRETLRFLEVDESFQPDFRVINPNKRLCSKALKELIQEPPWTVRGLVKTLLPRQFRRKLQKSLMRLNVRYERRQPMDPELRRKLQAEFVQEIKQLSILLGRNLICWKFNEAML